MILSPIKVLIIKDYDDVVRVVTRGIRYTIFGDFVSDLAKSHSVDYKINTLIFENCSLDLRQSVMFNYKLDLLVNEDPLELAKNNFDKFLERESAFDTIWEVAEDGYGI